MRSTISLPKDLGRGTTIVVDERASLGINEMRSKPFLALRQSEVLRFGNDGQSGALVDKVRASKS